MKLRQVIIIFFAAILVGCIPLRVVPKYNPDIYNGYKAIQAFQKKETIGHTDVKQREIDLYACGVRNLFGGTLDLTVQYPEMTSKQVDERQNSIYSCIKSKGYVVDSPESCTLKGKPTGFCN